MKLCKIVFISLLTLFFVSSPAVAGDYGWTRDFDIRARGDSSGFRAAIATRFNLGDAKVQAVLSNFDSPADAYIALRLGEMSGRSIDYVTDKYKQHKGNGWGALANELGIKQGSDEFHALKRGHDLSYGNNERGRDSASGSNHGGGKSNGKDKDKGKGKGKK